MKPEKTRYLIWLVPLIIVIGTVLAIVLTSGKSIMTKTPLTTKQDEGGEEKTIEQTVLSVPVYNPLVREDVALQNESPVIKSFVEPNQKVEDCETYVKQLYSINYTVNNDITPNRYIVKSVETAENNLELSEIFTHIACLSRAIQKPGHTMILNNIKLNRSSESINQMIQKVTTIYNGRWDVLMVTQKVVEWQRLDNDMCRIVKDESIEGYIVNEHYLKRLLLYLIQSVRYSLKSSIVKSLSQLFNDLQLVDVWIGFKIPLGIGNAKSHRMVREDFDFAICFDGSVDKLIVYDSGPRLKILIYSEEISELLKKECLLRLFKGHLLEFRECPMYQVEFENVDYIFYISKNVRIFQHLPNEELLIDKVVTVETETFHGGPTLLYLEYCLTLDKKEWPTKILDKSYMYEEKCLYPESCHEPMCKVLQNFKPLIGFSLNKY